MRRTTKSDLADIQSQLELIKTVVMVREPATGLAAEAYEGLRRQVVASAAERVAHLQQLARLDAEIARGASLESVGQLIRDLMAETGLERVDVMHRGSESAFEDLGGDGDAWRVVEPAYVETPLNGQARVVRSGKAERIKQVLPGTRDEDQSSGAPSEAEEGSEA